MRRIDAKLLESLPLGGVKGVKFYKRDEVTTDLVCCEVTVVDDIWTFHEDLDGWPLLIQHLEQLPNFRGDWFSEVSNPPFLTCETIAYQRHS